MSKWFHEVWTNENADAIDAMFISQGQASGLGDRPLIGPNEFRQFHAALLGLLDEIRIEIEDHVCDGNKCAIICTLYAVCRKERTPVKMTGSCFFSIKDEQILQCENHFEFLSLFEQLNLLPESTFARALSGEKLMPSMAQSLSKADPPS